MLTVMNAALGSMIFPPSLSIPRTPSTMTFLGLASLISDLHCGHKIFGAPSDRLRLFFGASVSAIQSSRHSSCATKAQGQGSRHGEVSGVSSEESEKHIQHFFSSSSLVG